MRPGKILPLLLVLGLAAGCGGGGGGGGGSSSGGSGGSGGAGASTPPAPSPTCTAGVDTGNPSNTSPTPATGSNVVPVTVNGSLCSANSYLNKPCVQVTVCTPGTTPGTSTCVTVNDILLDTGSYGIRIFKQALATPGGGTLPLTQVTSGSGNLAGDLAECVQFGDGSSMWGSVQTAGIVLGAESVVNVPIQVVDSTFGSLPSACQNADASPAAAGFNGILGIGPLAQDCGATCTNASIGWYYRCTTGTGSTCRGTTVPLVNQVQNPVPYLPGDNNGVVVQLPAVDANGAASVDGALVLGIGTKTNNNPTGVAAYGLNDAGEFVTLFNGAVCTSILDTGSNGLFFPAPSSIPNCTNNPDWLCPSPSSVCLSATTEGSAGTPTSQDTFQIANFDSLLTSNPSSKVFPNVGANINGIGGSLSGMFDWGLPFYLGRSVYVGIEGESSPLGAGPYFAY